MIAYIIWNLEPTIFHGFEYLRWYGFCWFLGILFGYQIMLRIYNSENVPSIELDKLTTYMVLGIILGARLGHILFYEPLYYLKNPVEVLPFKIYPTFQFTGFAGLASHGGVLGGLIALYLFRKKYQRNYLWLLDRVVIASAVLGGFIRLGNLLNSEIVGTPTSLPWAFIFSKVDQIPRHPSQLYEAIFYWVIGIALFLIWKSGKYERRNGFIFGLGLTTIFAQRFLIEFVKENQVLFEESLALNMGQFLSIPLIITGLLLMLWSVNRPQVNPE